MRAGVSRSLITATVAAPLVILLAPPAAANQPVSPDAERPAAAAPVDQPVLSDIDEFYIHVTICVHIPTPGSATLDWCWP
ncbi:hypothetical protein [Nocardia sp. NPDC004722]